MNNEDIIKKINEKYGKNSIISLLDTPSYWEVASTGSLNLDDATGIGGFPYGRVVEIMGQESVGKSTFVLELLAANPSVPALLIDTEHGFSVTYAKSLGVNLETLSFSQPDSAEHACNLILEAVESGHYKIVILDSIAALTSQKEIDGEVGDSTIAQIARLMSQFLRKLVPLVDKQKVLFIAINQFRASLAMFGASRTTCGGNAMKYAASIRIEISKKLNTTAGETNSITSTCKFIKNKCAAPFTFCDIDILFGEGFDTAKEIIDRCVEKKLIVKGGAWFTYGEIKLQGLEKMKDFLNDNPGLIEELKAKLKE